MSVISVAVTDDHRLVTLRSQQEKQFGVQPVTTLRVADISAVNNAGPYLRIWLGTTNKFDYDFPSDLEASDARYAIASAMHSQFFGRYR